MKVYVLVEHGGYDESDEVLGVYSTLELARAAEKAPQFGCCGIQEIEVDAAPEKYQGFVPDPPKPHWWDGVMLKP